MPVFIIGLLIVISIPLYCCSNMYFAVKNASDSGKEGMIEAARIAARENENILIGPPEVQIFIIAIGILVLLIKIYKWLKLKLSTKNEKLKL